MNATVIYESEFGATRRVADAIAEGLRVEVDADSKDVRDLMREAAGWTARPAELIVIGTPTHARSMPTRASREQAAFWPARPGSTLVLEPRAVCDGVREWLQVVDLEDAPVATFATRAGIPGLLAGTAARAIGRSAVRRGAELVAVPMTFVVQKDGTVDQSELARAREWGERLARHVLEAAAALKTH